MRIWDASGGVVFDSLLAAGGVPVGAWAGGAGTLSFPQFAGRQMQAMSISGPEWKDNPGVGVSISYASGYPVATVQPWAPPFLLAVY
jgi:hypothetical protein